jgi:Uma2 family endonuclease
VFEILSPATELVDRTDKRRDYQRLESLRHYVLIAQDAPRVEIYSRTGPSWRFDEIEGQDATLPLDALEITLPLAEIYDGLSYPPLSDAISAA